MEKKTTIHASEREIVSLIQKHITPKYDSIVAAEELGNHDWTVEVEPANNFDETEVLGVSTGHMCYHWRTRQILNVLCKEGHLEAGDYVIDCTW